MTDNAIHRYRYDLQSADEAGETEHPRLVIRRHAPDAHLFEPSSFGECWFFSARAIELLPGYIVEVEKRVQLKPLWELASVEHTSDFLLKQKLEKTP